MRLARKNEAALLQKMRLRLARYRNVEDDHRADYTVGCVLLQQPFFLEERDWIPAPVDWSRKHQFVARATMAGPERDVG
jgi:putative restriction endonuclease